MYNSLQVGDFDRIGVVKIGPYPIDTIHFNDRKLEIINTSIKEAQNYFKNSKAIIIVDDPSQYALIEQSFRELYKEAVNHGLKFIICFHSDEDFKKINELTQGISSDNFYFYKNEIKDLAETIARYSPGPPEEKVIIESPGLSLETEVKLLLKRSFFGCTKIHVQSISGGKASLNLFKVYAWMKNSEVGPSPSPFFAKIATHKQIEQELNNYRVFTDLYISFRFRPNCRIERCVKTLNYASLVGDFVDDAISLRSALQDAHQTTLIFSLFESSLKRFRLQPFVSKKDPSVGILKDFIKDRIAIEKLMDKVDVIEKAESFGLKTSITELYKRLLNACPETCITGPIHGDLNSRNVMVKGSDAILIDFYSVKNSGPLTADPANLEISLSFELDSNVFPPFEEWKSFIDEAYNPEQILKPLVLKEQIPNEFSWLRKAIRETRHVLIGCECCKEEIQVVIACFLMRAARQAPIVKNKKDKMEFNYRAYALVVAEKIINYLNRKNKC